MSDNVDLSWADGDVKTAATMIAGRAIAVRMAGPLTETPQAKAIIEKAAFSLDELKARAGQVSNSIQEWYKKDPSVAHGIGIGAGVGGLAGLGTSMASGGRRPVLDTALGALLGAGVGGAGTHFYNTTREAQQPNDPNAVTLQDIKKKEQELAAADPVTTAFGRRLLPDREDPSMWDPRAPGRESLGGAFGAGAAPIAGATVGANAGTLALSRLALGKGKGVMLPSWANKSLMGLSAISGGVHAADRLYSGADMTPAKPTTPLTPFANEAATNPAAVRTPEFQDKVKPLLGKSGSLFTTNDIMSHWNNIPKGQQSAIMGGGIGAGIGGLTGLMSGKRKLRNSLLGAVMGGGLGAGAGYLYGQPSPTPQVNPEPQPSTSPTAAATSGPPPVEEGREFATLPAKTPVTGPILGAAGGGTAGALAAKGLTPLKDRAAVSGYAADNMTILNPLKSQLKTVGNPAERAVLKAKLDAETLAAKTRLGGAGLRSKTLGLGLPAVGALAGGVAGWSKQKGMIDQSYRDAGKQP